jgi:hypothetical protein
MTDEAAGKSATSEKAETWNGQRLEGFARFFKGYMSVSAIVAASVPIPVASLKLIPAYAQQRGFLTVYSSLLCFLLVAFVFSIRHGIGARIFYSGKGGLRGLIAALPAVAIVCCIACIGQYHWTLQKSLETWMMRGVTATSEQILSGADLREIPYSLPLTIEYLGIFVFAELAFVVMAMREYLQEELHLEERALIEPKKRRMRPRQTKDGE